MSKEFLGKVVEREIRQFLELDNEIDSAIAEHLRLRGIRPNVLYLDTHSYQTFKLGWWPRVSISVYKGMRVMVVSSVNKEIIRVDYRSVQ